MPGKPSPPPSRSTSPSRRAIPAPWRNDLAEILIPEEAIARRVRDLAATLGRDFAGRDLVVVAVLNGTVMFLADLLRQLPLPLRLDFVRVSSYGTGTTSGALQFTRNTSLDVRGRDVLVVDDILDTGKTLDCVTTHLRQFKPRRLRTCVLLDKKARRQVKIRADYVGFPIPDVFVVGYGLDFAERYRNLPFIGVLDPAIYQMAAAPASTSAPAPGHQAAASAKAARGATTRSIAPAQPRS